MKIIVDTSIWSLALRRKNQAGPCAEVRKLVELISESRAQIIGPIRQEILSGIKSTTQFEALRRQLEAFPDLPLDSSDYEKAASFYNACRRRGVQGSNTDFLICAVSQGRQMPIFTNDSDFEHFQKIIHIKLYT
jgi:predicted nucleic acid-binding protein